MLFSGEEPHHCWGLSSSSCTLLWVKICSGRDGLCSWIQLDSIDTRFALGKQIDPPIANDTMMLRSATSRSPAVVRPLAHATPKQHYSSTPSHCSFLRATYPRHSPVIPRCRLIRIAQQGQCIAYPKFFGSTARMVSPVAAAVKANE
jgi:hypothetical protein